MKQVSHKIMSLLMAVVVLFSTMSFTLSMHYCGGTLVETALFHKATGCGMEMEKPSAEGCVIAKSNCCNDEQISVAGQDELQIVLNTISFEQQVFLASFIYSHINLFEGLENKVSFYEDYKPPLVSKQIFKLDESYLI